MNFLKSILDKISPKTPSQQIQEADADNMGFDKRKADESIKKLLTATDEFTAAVTHLVTQVVRDVEHERRRRHEKTTSRSGKT